VVCHRSRDVNITPEAVGSLLKLSKGDMCRAPSVRQATHAGSRPLPMRREPPPKEKDELITNDTIYTYIAAPHPADIRLVTTTLVNTPDVTSCLSTINKLKASRGLALANILTSLAEELQALDVLQPTRALWLEGLSKIEFRLAGEGLEGVQAAGWLAL
jgi:replication factor C subunit 3/5